jgi:hypothetical protein
VTADDALDRDQADTSALEFIGRVQPLKHAEELRRIRHVEAGSVVTNEVCWLSAILASTEFDAGFRPPRGELPRVAQQVVEHDTEEPFIPMRKQPVGDDDLGRSITPGPSLPASARTG